MKNILYLILFYIMINPLYATKNHFQKSISIGYLGGDIDGNILKMLKTLEKQDVLKIKKNIIKKDAPICPLLKEQGLYMIDCTKALEKFVIKINGGKKVFKKGDVVNLPILKKYTYNISQLTRVSNFIPLGKKSISKNNLQDRLLQVNIRDKSNYANNIIKTITNRPSDNIFYPNEQVLITDRKETIIRYKLKDFLKEETFSFNNNSLDFHEDRDLSIHQKIKESLSSTSNITTYHNNFIRRSPRRMMEPPYYTKNTSIYWNTFISDRSETKNYTMLTPNRNNYKLKIQLSPYKYKDSDMYYTKGISDSFIKLVDKFCRDWEEGQTWLEEIRIVPITSSDDIGVTESINGSSKLDMGKLCSYRQDTKRLINKKDMQAFIKNGDKQKFIFLNKSFKLSTGENASGYYSIAFSIWHGNKPIDNIVMKLCVGDNNKCNNSPLYVHQDANIMHLSNDLNVSRVASLHFFDFDEKNIAALFWDYNSSKISSWLINRTKLDGDQKYIRFNINKKFPKYKEISSKLFDAIFSDNNISDHFIEVLDVKNKKPFSYLNEISLPEIYIRSEGTNVGNLNGMPISLLPTSKDYNSSKLLGLHYKIYRPLASLPTEKNLETCIDKNIFMYPDDRSEDKAIKSALDYRSDLFKKYYSETNITKIKVSNDFIEWYESDNESRALFVFLGHFGIDDFGGILSFSPVTSDMGIRVGEFPGNNVSSIAILDACGTGMQGGFEFVNGLNARGFSSIISTNSVIEARLGQAYLNCLVKKLPINQSKDIGLIHVQTLNCLYNEKKDGKDPNDKENKKSRNFEADVLKFTLYGVHNVKICK